MAADQAGDEISSVSADAQPSEIDSTRAHIARVYDYWLDGKDNFAADREAAEQVIAAYPGIRTSVRAQRAFLGRAVHHLAADADIRQFLDIGAGLPSTNNTHEIAQRVAPESRVVYVDNDPIVLVHARALLTSTPEGATAYIHADLRDTATILREAAHTLDLSKPTAVMLLGILPGIPDEQDPGAIVARLMAALPSGSHLVISHVAKDIGADQMAEAMRRYNERASLQGTMRTHAEVSRFFEGLDLVAPGVVQVHQWRPGTPGALGGHDIANYGGVGRKP